jgi:hypothetical protein
MIIVDSETLQPITDFDEGLKLCESLGLIEIMQHGGDEYTRFTRKGMDVHNTLMELIYQHAETPEPGDVLRGS